APLDFVSYLVGTWMKDKVKQMWSAVYCGSRNIFEMCNTNMLVEAYWKFLGKHNRHLDHLVHTLVQLVVPYYTLKQCHQDSNFEGPDIETKKCVAILK
ncbi:hypothetical protein DFH08DRAFT_617371, partial [Mycena albidolilacea]